MMKQTLLLLSLALVAAAQVPRPGSGTPGAADGLGTATQNDIAARGFCVDAGTTNAYACSLSPAISGYVQGAYYSFQASSSNTSPTPTVNFNGLGAVQIVQRSDATLAAGTIKAAAIVTVRYDGEAMQMISASALAPTEIYQGFDAGGDDAYVVAPSNFPTVYTNGMTMYLCTSTANTGAATLDAGPGPKAIKLANGTSDPADNDIFGANECRWLQYRTAANGGVGAWIIQLVSAAGGSITVNAPPEGAEFVKAATAATHNQRGLLPDPGLQCAQGTDDVTCGPDLSVLLPHIEGAGAPTSTACAAIGTRYTNTSSDRAYRCIATGTPGTWQLEPDAPIAPEDLPNPGVGSKGGVESLTCSGTDKISAIGTDGVPVCSEDGGGGGGGGDPLTTMDMFEDFCGGSNTNVTIGSWQWALSNGQGSFLTESNRPCVFQRSTGSSSGTQAQMYAPNDADGWFYITDSWTIDWSVRLNTNDANTTVRVGLSCGSLLIQPAAGAYFEKLDGDTNWFRVSRASSTETRQDTGTATGTGWIKFTIRYTGSAVGFAINGGSESTISTNNPSGTGCVPWTSMINSTAAAKTIDIDYVRVRMTLSGR